MIIGELSAYFTGLLHSVTNELAAGDPLTKGLITVGILGVTVRAARNVPQNIMSYIRRLSQVSVQFEDYWHGNKKNSYEAAAAFISKHQAKRRHRLLKVEEDRSSNYEFVTGPQASSGVFFIGLRPFWYNSADAKEQGSVPRSVTITTIGKSPDNIFNAIEVVEKIRATKKARSYYTTDGKTWDNAGKIMSTCKLFLPTETKNKLDKAIDFFKDHSQWYYDRGINHKLLIILYGPPGSGKSSISAYVANRLGWSLGTINGIYGFDTMIRAAAGSNMVVSMPDIDTLGIGLRRKGMEPTTRQERMASSEEPNKPVKETTWTMTADGKTIKGKGDEVYPDRPVAEDLDDEAKEEMQMLDKSDITLNRILNLFQGDIPLNGSVVVASTNCVDKLDPALLRSSRCDVLLEIGPLGQIQIQDFYGHYYSTEEKLPEEFTDAKVMASDLMGAFTDNPFDSEKFIEVVKEKVF